MVSTQAPTAFVQKIKHRMNDENIGVTELARKLKVSHPTVVELVTYGKKPSFDTCMALAKWFNESPVSVLREAGLLPADTSDDDPWVEDMSYKIGQLSPTLRSITERFVNGMLDEQENQVKPKPKTKSSTSS